jgi:hypothetical protein
LMTVVFKLGALYLHNITQSTPQKGTVTPHFLA